VYVRLFEVYIVVASEWRHPHIHCIYIYKEQETGLEVTQNSEILLKIVVKGKASGLQDSRCTQGEHLHGMPDKTAVRTSLTFDSINSRT
jgi:hypothetical protein